MRIHLVAATDIMCNNTFSTNFRSWDFAVPGSPRSKTLMSPRKRIPSGRIFLEPPKRRHEIAFFMSELQRSAMSGKINTTETYLSYHRCWVQHSLQNVHKILHCGPSDQILPPLPEKIVYRRDLSCLVRRLTVKIVQGG